MTNERRYKREPRSVAEIQANIRATRGRIDATLKALGDRLTADALLHSALQFWNSRPPARDGTTRKAAPSLARQIRDNLIPKLMVGGGLAWMVIDAAARDQSKTKSVAEASPPETTGSRPSDHPSDLAGISPERGRRSAMVDRAQEKMHPTAETTPHRSSTKHLRNSRGDEYPLALGIGFAALGALIGAILPRFPHKDELSRAESDQFAEPRKGQGRELLRNDKVAPHDVTQSASQPQDLTPKAVKETISEGSAKSGGGARKAKERPARAAGEKKRTAAKRKAPRQVPIPGAQKKSDENG
jgi:hypothetical protein